MKKSFVFAAMAALITSLISCGGGKGNTGSSNGGEVTVSGAFALYPLAVQWADDFMQKNPDIHVDVSAGGAGKGMTDVLAGMVDFAMVSREPYAEEMERGIQVYSVARDAVVADINVANPYRDTLLQHGITAEMATKIWLQPDGLTWGDLLGTDAKEPVHVYTRSDACGAAETWANFFGKKQEDLEGTAVFGDPGIAAAVQKDVYGIGFNNIAYAYDAATRKAHEGLTIVPLDLNQDGSISEEETFYGTLDELMQAISEGKYIAPPARTLYMIAANSEISPAAKAFMDYILSDGQQLNESAGFIPIYQTDEQ